ncbi:hypothetical protein M378DRAFT_170758 [Amanita muscaria Koide BX008]|uniref:Secreted protein n=1 Tax=Amanita muscaria (strain Koide BX008) TaxID=946122 RepID=A0A0C2WAP0_AMAMK|nr:hypothetical protein M378DRAFT_170758 [Amanita muscaria Koide BX008]
MIRVAAWYAFSLFSSTSLVSKSNPTPSEACKKGLIGWPYHHWALHPIYMHQELKKTLVEYDFVHVICAFVVIPSTLETRPEAQLTSW